MENFDHILDEFDKIVASGSDPAILLYTQDFLVGVSDLTNDEAGQYIKLLCVHQQKGRLTEKTICLTVGSVSDDVLRKFIVDENGKYYNKRLVKEVVKRSRWTASRRENAKKGGRPKKPYEKATSNHMENHMDMHMGNENDNDNENKNESIDVNKESSVAVVAKEVIAHLNTKADTNYRASSKATQRHIKARLNEGFSVDDFKTVINKKTADWKGKEWAKYLRPETLFGTKFEGYLNQSTTPQVKSNPSTKHGEPTLADAERMQHLLERMKDEPLPEGKRAAPLLPEVAE